MASRPHVSHNPLHVPSASEDPMRCSNRSAGRACGETFDHDLCEIAALRTGLTFKPACAPESLVPSDTHLVFRELKLRCL